MNARHLGTLLIAALVGCGFGSGDGPQHAASTNQQRVNPQAFTTARYDRLPEDSRTVLSPSDGEPLVRWVEDDELEAQWRVLALRRLDQVDSPQAEEIGLRWLQQDDPDLKLGAISLLARSDSPRVMAALAQSGPRHRGLALSLRQRGS